jgi:putative aldouronate transport system substrate-binding protein
MITTGYVNTQSWGVASNSQNPEKAVQLLDLIYTNTDLANLFNYGIEGTNYVKQEGSKNIITYPEGKDSATCGYGGDAITWFGDSSKVFQRTPNTDDFFTKVADFGPAKAVKSTCLGYTFDTSKVSTQLAAVQSVINTYKPSLTTGNANPDEVIPQFLQELKAAGIDEVIKENQTQLDAWLATK